jgi:hypothetical protein
MSDDPILTAIGEHVALGPLERHHLPLLLRWMHEAEYQRTTSRARPLTLAMLEQSFERGSNAADEVHLAIYEQPSLRLIGALT